MPALQAIQDKTSSGLGAMTEFEKMINGEHYNSLDLDLRLKREAARLACAKYNAHPSKGNLKHITRLFAQSEQVIIEPGFQCDYGSQIYLGKGVYINFQCVLLDSAPIHIGDHVLIGPAAHLYTVDHPRDAAARAAGECFARPIHIGNRVWIGGGAKVLPGINIGDDAIIAANAVVTRNVAQGERYFG